MHVKYFAEVVVIKTGLAMALVAITVVIYQLCICTSCCCDQTGQMVSSLC